MDPIIPSMPNASNIPNGLFPKSVSVPNDVPHFVTGSGNVAFDVTTGTMYARTGNTVLGTDGSVRTIIDSGNMSTLIGPDGVRTIRHSGNIDTVI